MNAQTLFLPDPRPLVERLGAVFFRRLPEVPGVYLMRDSAGAVLYVGKAKNLRRRLGSYRVANPDRLPRRHLRLLHAVARIELQECPDEATALAREAELLRELRPRFNRAGTWPGSPKFLLWRVTERTIEMSVSGAAESSWHIVGPMGAGADMIRASVLRLLWSAVHPDQHIAAMPHAWFRGRRHGISALALPRFGATESGLLEEILASLFSGDALPFAAWVRERTAARTHPFELAACDADLENVVEFAGRQRGRVSHRPEDVPAPKSAAPGHSEGLFQLRPCPSLRL